jgi:hypothetical protein
VAEVDLSPVILLQVLTRARLAGPPDSAVVRDIAFKLGGFVAKLGSPTP